MQHYQLPLSQTARLIRQGAVIPTILSTIQEHQIDLVILCSHGTTERRNKHLGSVAQQLITQNTVPLLILKNGWGAPHTTYPDMHRSPHSLEIVVALDGSEQSERALLPAAHLISAPEICAALGIFRATLYRYAKEAEPLNCQNPRSRNSKIYTRDIKHPWKRKIEN
ncbi:universal stress protein [Dictyobacter arantiisoli]|uniref:universal stress protein n=1 Tax=Dictyobacter arantiisoli TaxID=2014874 RepID=UPI00155AA2B8